MQYREMPRTHRYELGTWRGESGCYWHRHGPYHHEAEIEAISQGEAEGDEAGQSRRPECQECSPVFISDAFQMLRFHASLLSGSPSLN